MSAGLVRGIGRRHLDLRLRSGEGLVVRVIERPGLWMDDAALAALVADLRTVAGRVLGGGALSYGVFAGERERLARSVVTLVSRRDGVPVAFNALALMEVDLPPRGVTVLHLGLVMVDPDARQRSLSWVLYGLTCLLLFLRGGLRPLWVSNVTQVPAVVGMVSGMFSDVWPKPESGPESGPVAGRRSLLHLLLARRIMAGHRHVFGVGEEARFDEDRFVVMNAYTGGSDGLKKRFDDAAPHRDPAVNAFCRARLDYDRGDDVLQLGRIDLAAVRRYLSRDVPAGALGAVSLAAVMVLLQRLVLPVVGWADGRRAWSILRPAR